MPNRKTFDANDRYDHSSHSTRKEEPGDLRSTPQGADASASKSEGDKDLQKAREGDSAVRRQVPSEEAPPRRGAPRKNDSD